ncbi:MAG: formimidoylglutamate deiminase [Proteobacteria bacterium]|nr:MAG: formimidoylglutamate deiminase [Pseudomonadota bacterium]
MNGLWLPGFANAHSHAFQRLLRGDVQRRAPGRADSFWTWRDTMYRLANRLSLEELEATARRCYAECLEAGYTAVGEFHYLHHAPNGAPWPDPLAASRAHLRAARDAGIRITLLWTVYARGGIGAPLGPHQRRFAVASAAAAIGALDALAASVDGRSQRVGLALHSVRAVPRSWLGPLAEAARARGLPIHVHVSEQLKEVADCQAAHGLSPVQLLAAEGALGPDVTAVHATWLDARDVTLLAECGVTVCLCPTTEGDLGDGFPATDELHAAGVPLCVGSDSHAVIDPFAELRLAEYQARAKTGRRCVLTDEAGRCAPALGAVGHAHGYRALGLDGDGDRVRLRVDDRVFEGAADPTSVALVGGHRGLVDAVEVAGERVVEAGRHVSIPSSAERL